MPSYCLKYKRNTENINQVISKPVNGGTMILSKCTTCGSKTLRFVKKEEVKWLLSNLVLKYL